MRSYWITRAKHEALKRDYYDAKQNAQSWHDANDAAEKMASVLQACLDSQRQLAADERTRADARYADLMASYRLLRLNGHAEPAPKPPQPKDETVTAIARAIREAAHGNAPLMKTMWQQVDRDRVNSLSDLDILHRIQHGTTTDEGVPA